jgi:hypothetical protein
MTNALKLCVLAASEDRRATGRHLSPVPDAGRVRDPDMTNRHPGEVRWEVLLLEPVHDWFLTLCMEDPRMADKVEEALDELATRGPQLGRPLVDRIHDSRIHDLKELRRQVSGTAEVRLLFAFDPAREASVLVAGGQTGRWSAWYREVIPVAEERYAAYRREALQEGE